MYPSQDKRNRSHSLDEPESFLRITKGINDLNHINSWVVAWAFVSSIHHIPDSVVLSSHKRQLQMISRSPFQPCKLLITPKRLGFNCNMSTSISANLSAGRQLMLLPVKERSVAASQGLCHSLSTHWCLAGALVADSWWGERKGCRSWDIHFCHANSWAGDVAPPRASHRCRSWQRCLEWFLPKVTAP